ncbi:hypothetical protein PMKS-001867 [Pichia membranifaciens]|uniref:Xylanolytic transcriptional activator regulatory domain-containing protein n=1 Tax=Pichia membranifaciens TaxID=4926 RepID=A0A1Q2YFN9_9ASCO|nr:hypothetical protein PMKS-001867 [Pichia membranifaciens]
MPPQTSPEPSLAFRCTPRTISNPTKLAAIADSTFPANDILYSSTAPFSTSFPYNRGSSLPSPKSSNIRTSPIIRLPPIRQIPKVNQPAGQDDLLPPLNSYSLQQRTNPLANNVSSNPLNKLALESTILPSIPKQLLKSHLAYFAESLSASPSATSSTASTASYMPSYQSNIPSDEISAKKLIVADSLSSSSHRDDTFLPPSEQILKTEDFTILNQDTNSIRSNSLFDISPPNSLEQDLLNLIFKKIGLIDENIFATFNNHNPYLDYDNTLNLLLKLVIFLDQQVVLKKLEEFKKTEFDWNETSLRNREDYFASIEFLLVYTCAILIANHQAGIVNSKYHKLIFTTAYKLFQRKCFPITRVQILRFMMLFEIITLLDDSDLDTAWFIHSNLSSYSLKWELNRSMKKKTLSGVTLSELEYTNRLFWSIFVAGSLICSTLGQQPKLSLNDINVSLPIAITKDEEGKIVTQVIIINMCKIQSQIISELYVANAKSQISNDPERFAILSALRQDADAWYNDCRVSLSKLSQLRQENKIKSEVDDRTNIDDSFNINLHNFAAWVSQEYYYTLTQLFKSSNLFPKPETPNFTVISNATYQNTALLQDLILSKKIPNSSFVLYRFANTSLSVLISFYKETFSVADCKELLENMLNIWRCGTDDLSRNCYKCILDVRSILIPTFTDAGKENDVLKLGENSAKLLLELINYFASIMEQHGFSISVDNEYIKSCKSKE